MSRWKSAFLSAALAVAPAPAFALGEEPFVAFEASAGAALLVDGDKVATLVTDSGEHEGVVRAAADLKADIERVTGAKPNHLRGVKAFGPHAIVIGTLGKSGFIDGLAQSGAIDVSAIRGQWEGFVIQAIKSPWSNEPILVIAGSDKRGTIFGIYTLSEQIGVSPWYWWADVPPAQHKRLYVPAATRVADKPVVQYRGIFLNDEEPALTGWAKEKYGGYNHKFYTKVFELILRLRGNYLWPAMWRSAFFDDDAQNGKLADEYGIVMATSHHEPMMRAHIEWHRHGNGPWDYTRNQDELRKFWRDGVSKTADYEKAITLGMRGDGDSPMESEANVALLEKIVADQRAIIANEYRTEPSKVLQVWALYKEVQEYYEKGMRVPDDVLLLWCDDNYGNNRRLPTPAERKRPGGAGIYYHFDYVGGPRSYKWLNVTPLPKIWEQMHLAWKYEANRLWIVNVGDLKPMEVPIEFFLTYAWNPSRWPADRLQEYLRLWAQREFGTAVAHDVADIVAKYAKYNGRRKPEALEPSTYSLLHYGEAERIVAEYNAIAERAEKIHALLPATHRDAFFQLVLYPARAGATVTELYVTAAMNRLHANQGRASANDLAARARELFALDAELERRYHQDIAGGKWNHMMSQTRMGYLYWNDPVRNVMPAVHDVRVSKAADMGVAVEGNEHAPPRWGQPRQALPVLDAYERRPRSLEVFNRGEEPFDYSVSASEPWITLSRRSGTVKRGERILVGARWDEIPPDAQPATVTVTGANGRRITVDVPVRAATSGASGFVETRGVVSIEAEHFSREIAPGGRKWLRIPDHGRTLSAMTTLPVESAPEGMALEYDVHLAKAGKVKVVTTFAPTQKFQPGEGLRFEVAIGDEPPQRVNMHADESRPYWSKTVLDGVAVFTTEHSVPRAGANVLRFRPLDPGIVLQKIVIDAGGLQPSYLGPPESPRITAR
ncbi:glycosyl hydrolase 115 family protein [Usitatibacter palustris]|uniref:Gylcosyl hydrolase 115 C-terminal domain-containing protein n=1 Tax=Usitatibacter palustris TaxID=2732487 RepID=A0A6M4H6U3_9PROT|nr:glycosyl hydrolase 115 family protein [Usitatibacter palustris]QJR15250.1 hypothetical protein DSM104440_02067 [Usitatibacter palustris]